MDNLDKKFTFSKERTLENSGLPSSLDKFLTKLLEKIDKVKEARPFDTYLFNTRELILDINRFLNNLRDYKESVDSFERIIKEISSGLEEKGEKERYETLLKELDFKRKISHDSIIKNFIRIIETYNQTFNTLSLLPVDSYFTQEKKEEFQKERFPWRCSLILDKEGKLQSKFYDKDNNIDLTFLTNEEREIFSQWALKLSEELEKAEENKNDNKEENLEENKELANLKLNLKLLEEEVQKINKIK